MHCKGIVHRDLKSENILIASDGRLVLMDFSCSNIIKEKYIKDLKEFKDVDDNSEYQLEQSELLESIKGTILWMSPEVINQKKYGRKVDIWSFGCTLIEIITGKNPWNNLIIDNFLQALYQIGNTNSVPECPMNISYNLKNFLGCCLKRSYTERSSVKDLLNHSFLNE